MDTILSVKSGAKKRKDHQKNKVSKEPMQIKEAHYLEEYRIKIEFNDHTVKEVDFGDFLLHHPHPQYNKYKDFNLFKQFKIEAGNLVWGDNWDLIFPLNQLYKGIIKI